MKPLTTRNLPAWERAFRARLLELSRPIDIQTAHFLSRGNPWSDTETIVDADTPESRLFWLHLLVSRMHGHHHSGLSLAEDFLLTELQGGYDLQGYERQLKVSDLIGPLAELMAAFPDQICQAQEAALFPGTPLIVRGHQGLISYRKWFQLEEDIAHATRERLSLREGAFEPSKPLFQSLFGSEELALNPWQAMACLRACTQSFSLITGGPGTGKTTTIARLIALHLLAEEAGIPRQIHLVAPTGKAADRLEEAVQTGLRHLIEELPSATSSLLQERLEAVLQPARTIHRLLGAHRYSQFQNSAIRPLNTDLLIIDEAGMLDLELAALCLRALPLSSKLVLAGDRNQLSSVNTGNFFHDLTQPEGGGLNATSKYLQELYTKLSGMELAPRTGSEGPLGNAITELEHSYRFAQATPIGSIAREVLTTGVLSSEQHLDIVHTGTGIHSTLPEQFYAAYGERLQEKATPADLLQEMDRRRILCATRTGPSGVEQINAAVVAAVLGLKNWVPGNPEEGLPFIIRKNDSYLGVANGETGVFLRDASGQLRAYVQDLSSEAPEGTRSLSPYQLPSWEAAFAITIHQSQGSEYDEVCVLLGEARENFISRELVYTAVTRARRELSLFVTERLLGKSLPANERISGLREALKCSGDDAG